VLAASTRTALCLHLNVIKTSNIFLLGFYSRDQLKCDGTRAETRFRRSAKRTSPFKSSGASVQSKTGSRGVRISGSNAGYTMFRGSVKSTGYPLHSPVSPESVAHVLRFISMRERLSKNCWKDGCTFGSAVARRLTPLSPCILEPVRYHAPIGGGACREGHVSSPSKIGSVPVCRWVVAFVLLVSYRRGEKSSPLVLCPSTLLSWGADVC
jgi:hypothetical protein